MSPPINLHWLDEVDSTQMEARRRWSATAGAHPLAVAARRQTGGLGRLGRNWVSPEGGLWITIAWPLRLPLGDYGPLPLVVGLAAAQAIEESGHLSDFIRLKWPNDLLLGERKIGGILCQTQDGAIFIGVGLNLLNEPEELGSNLRYPPSSVKREAGSSATPQETAPQLLGRLAVCLREFERDGLEPFLTELQTRLTWFGETIEVEQEANEPIIGEMMGIDATGRLLVQVAGQTKSFASGDVTRVRRRA